MRKITLIFGTVLGMLFTATGQPYLSPCDVDRDEQMLFITAQTGQKLLLFDTTKNAVTREISFNVPLNETCISPDGKTLYVTAGEDAGKLFIIDATSGDVKQTIPTGHTPMSPVLSPEGQTLYVCNRFNNDVSLINLSTGETTARIPVLREPIAADISPDGQTLFVANHIPEGAADLDYIAAKISAIDTLTREVKTIPLVNGAEGLRDLKVSPDGQFVYVTHLMARFLVPTTQLERGWISTDALSIIRVADQSLLYTVLLDDVDRGFPNPWAIGFSDDGMHLLITSAGLQEMSLIDLPAMTQKMKETSEKTVGEAHLNAHNDLAFLSGIRQRIKLSGNGPRALTVVGKTAYITHYFSDTLEAIDFSNPIQPQSQTYRLGPDLPITQERQGEIYFNSAELCFQNWLSCATCHPDARTDGLNWDLLNDGMGNPKNVKSMLLAHETPRAMWLGVRDDAETGVRAGLKYIQFAIRPEEDAQAIDAYLKSLKAVTSPYRKNGRLSESARRGQQIFKYTGCANCHPAPLFTDLKMHDVGTPKEQDIGKSVDTPSLVEGWRTAPYLHDGRAATMRELLTTFDHAGTLSKTAELSPQEIDDLVEYLNSL